MSGRPEVHSGQRKRSLRKSSMLRAPESELGKTPPEHGRAPPSRAAWVGFRHLGKTAHFTGTETLPPVSPHKGTKLGALARRQGLGCGVVVPNAHARTGSKTKGKKTSSANPLVAAQTPTVSPWHVGQCVHLKAPPPTRRGGYPFKGPY